MNVTSQNRIALLHPKIRNEVLLLVNKANDQLTGRSQVLIVQGLRTFYEQQILYSQGRSKPGKKVTNAQGGQSYHNYGLAVDFALLIDGKEVSWNMKKDWDGDMILDWLEVVNIFREAEFEWGGMWRFRDNPHFQKRFGYHWKALLKKYNSGDFIEGAKYVSI